MLIEKQVISDINSAYYNHSFNRCKETLDAVILAGDTLVKYYIKLYGSGYSFDDLYQQGMVGLLKAANSFNAENNTAFVTWASWCIISEIRHHVRKEHQYYFPKTIDELERNQAQADEQIFYTQNEYEKLSRNTNVMLLNIDDIENTKNISEYHSFQLAIEDKLALEQAIAKLSELQKKVLNALFYKQMSQQQAADALGLNQRKVSRVKESGIKALAVLLEGPSFKIIENSKSFKKL
jgi:RNA polymerase sigma factor (sigma-70 family)